MSGFGMPCGVCGKPATIADGMCGAYLCEDSACLDVAWDRAFGDTTTSPAVVSHPTGDGSG